LFTCYCLEVLVVVTDAKFSGLGAIYIKGQGITNKGHTSQSFGT
jgi:hypothetical protein